MEEKKQKNLLKQLKEHTVFDTITHKDIYLLTIEITAKGREAACINKINNYEVGKIRYFYPDDNGDKTDYMDIDKYIYEYTGRFVPISKKEAFNMLKLNRKLMGELTKNILSKESYPLSSIYDITEEWK